MISIEKLLLAGIKAYKSIEYTNGFFIAYDFDKAGDFDTNESNIKMLDNSYYQSLMEKYQILRITHTILNLRVFYTMYNPNLMILTLSNCKLKSLNFLTENKGIKLANFSNNYLTTTSGIQN